MYIHYIIKDVRTYLQRMYKSNLYGHKSVFELFTHKFQNTLKSKVESF